MASHTKLTDAATLELYKVALENAENQTEIASVMAELGYDNTEVGLYGQTLRRYVSAKLMVYFVSLPSFVSK